jgi:hypothetical protein
MSAKHPPMRACATCPYRRPVRKTHPVRHAAHHGARFVRNVIETLTVEVCVLVLIWFARTAAFATALAVLSR